MVRGAHFTGRPGGIGARSAAGGRADCRWARIYSRWEFSAFLRLGCADYIQPDVTHVGGLAEPRRIAALAECFHIPICPHNPSGPVANAATLQIAACTPNFYLLETMTSDVPHRGEISSERVRCRDGMMAIPDGPGLDIDIDEAAMARYPYTARDLRHYSGQLTDIRPDDATTYFEA